MRKASALAMAGLILLAGCLGAEDETASAG